MIRSYSENQVSTSLVLSLHHLPSHPTVPTSPVSRVQTGNGYDRLHLYHVQYQRGPVFFGKATLPRPTGLPSRWVDVPPDGSPCQSSFSRPSASPHTVCTSNTCWSTSCTWTWTVSQTRMIITTPTMYIGGWPTPCSHNRQPITSLSLSFSRKYGEEDTNILQVSFGTPRLHYLIFEDNILYILYLILNFDKLPLFDELTYSGHFCWSLFRIDDTFY